MAVVNVHQKRRAGDAPDPASESYADLVEGMEDLHYYYRFEEDAEGPFAPSAGLLDDLEFEPPWGGGTPAELSKVPSASASLGEALKAGVGDHRVLYTDSLPETIAVPGGDGYSMGFWVKPGSGGVGIVEGTENEAADNHYWHGAGAYNDEGGLGLWVDAGHDEGADDIYAEFLHEEWNEGEWAFVGFTFDRSAGKVAAFVNGVKVGEEAGDVPPLGARWGWLDIDWNDAAIDEVFAVAKVLSEQEWADLYAAASEEE